MASGGVAQLCDCGLLGNFGAALQGRDDMFCRGASGELDVQRLLAKDPLVKTSQGGTEVDSEIVGERRLQPSVRVECIVLALRNVVSSYQLCPQRCPVGVLDHQRFELADYGMGSPTSYLGLCPHCQCHQLVFRQRRGEGFDELKVPQILEHRATPFGKRGRQMAASLLELAGGRSLKSRFLFDREAT